MILNNVFNFHLQDSEYTIINYDETCNITKLPWKILNHPNI